MTPDPIQDAEKVRWRVLAETPGSKRLQQLLSEGWEPFAVTTEQSAVSWSHTIWLRRTEQIDGYGGPECRS